MAIIVTNQQLCPIVIRPIVPVRDGRCRCFWHKRGTIDSKRGGLTNVAALHALGPMQIDGQLPRAEIDGTVWLAARLRRRILGRNR